MVSHTKDIKIKEFMHIRLVKTIILAATCLCSMSVSAQDLIARQAPVDVKLKSVDSLALRAAALHHSCWYPLRQTAHEDGSHRSHSLRP